MFPRRKDQINARFARVVLLAVLVVNVIVLAACASIPAPVPTFTPFAAPSPTTAAPPTAPAVPTDTAEPVSPALEADTGWQAEYYSNETWTGPAIITRVDPEPVFDWQQSSPDPALPVDAFTVRWTRCLDLEGRYYIFTANADDYVRVLVDDILVQESLPPGTEIPFAVTAGRHCIKVEYREFIGFAYVNFAFRPGEAFPVADPATAWQGEYFNNRDFTGPATFTRNDLATQFDWQLGNAAPGLPVDNFSARWTRCLDLEGRDYVFSAKADEYVRVLVDDLQVLEALASVTAETTIPISAGNHCIKVEYREDQGPANVSVSFR
jgi:hypothetical protein